MKNPNRTANQRRAAAGHGVGRDTIVIFDTKYKSTEQYAKWISDALDTDLVPYSRKYLGYASLYRNVVYIGCVRDGEIEHLNLLQQNYMNFNLAGKKIVVVAVGLGADSKSYWKTLYDYNRLKGFADSFYCLPGDFVPNKLKPGDINKIDTFRRLATKTYSRKDAELILTRMSEGYRGLDPDKILPIVEEVKTFNN